LPVRPVLSTTRRSTAPMNRSVRPSSVIPSLSRIRVGPLAVPPWRHGR
jgi:hypothetical protein